MKKEKRFNIAIFIIGILLIIISFIADRFVFFDGKLAPKEYSFSRTESTKKNGVSTSLWFAYGKDRMLQYGIDNPNMLNDVRIYSKEGGGIISDYNVNEFKPKENSFGYVVAKAPVQKIDVDDDKILENVYDYSKTAFGTYALLGGPSKLFNVKDIEFELNLLEGKYIQVYYKNNILTNGTIKIVGKDNKIKEYNINKKGIIEKLPISTIRNGFTGVYTKDGIDYYRMYFTLEIYKYFSTHTLIGFRPLFDTVIFSIFIILIISFIRNMYNKNHDINIGTGQKNIGKTVPMTKFEKIRFAILITSFIMWTFLGRWIAQGQLLNQLTIPVFTCPFNYDQIIQASCFYLTHISHLLEEGWMFYVPFILTFILSIVFLGRIICGFLCPMGLLQEILDKIREKLHIKPIIISDKMNKILQLIKWIWIILFISLAFVGGDFCDICPNKIFAPVLNGYRIDLFIGGIFTIIVIVGSFYIKRFWCLICPLGYILGIFHKFNLIKLKKGCTACTECGACYEACPMKLKKIYTERKTENVQETDCLMCGKCIDKCPEDEALCMLLKNKKIYTSSREKFMSNTRK